MSTKMYVVTLDPMKCKSFTLPDGRKFLANRPNHIPEDKLGPFQSSGMFLIQPVMKREEGSVPKRKIPQPETNPDEKGEVLVEKERTKEKAEPKEEESKPEPKEEPVKPEGDKPKGVITTKDLFKGKK